MLSTLILHDDHVEYWSGELRFYINQDGVFIPASDSGFATNESFLVALRYAEDAHRAFSSLNCLKQVWDKYFNRALSCEEMQKSAYVKNRFLLEHILYLVKQVKAVEGFSQVVPFFIEQMYRLASDRLYPNAGFVYLMKRADGFYKIGRSVDPEKRRRELQFELKQAVECLHTIKSLDAVSAERDLHARFDGCRRGMTEKFALTDDDVNLFKSIKEI